jgi:hypothetical protein
MSLGKPISSARNAGRIDSDGRAVARAPLAYA